MGIDFGGKKIVYHSLYTSKYDLNASYIPSKENEVFFTIAVLTDFIDDKKYGHTNVSVTSRNFPHISGQGFVKTKSNKIDFVAFITADRNEYALVNMRLFDLRVGRVVLIAPQQDGTLRSLQLETPIMSSNEVDKCMKGLLTADEQVMMFFSAEGNI